MNKEATPLGDTNGPRSLRARWVVCGTMRLETAMHLGGEPTDRTDMQVLRDPREGAPLLPGSTLAGALRSALADRLAGYGSDEPEAVAELFGGRRGSRRVPRRAACRARRPSGP